MASSQMPLYSIFRSRNFRVVLLATTAVLLRPGGILFSSNPRGSSEEFSGDRYGHFMEFEVSRAYLEVAGFKVIEHYYRPCGTAVCRTTMACHCEPKG